MIQQEVTQYLKFCTVILYARSWLKINMIISSDPIETEDFIKLFFFSRTPCCFNQTVTFFILDDFEIMLLKLMCRTLIFLDDLQHIRSRSVIGQGCSRTSKEIFIKVGVLMIIKFHVLVIAEMFHGQCRDSFTRTRNIFQSHPHNPVTKEILISALVTVVYRLGFSQNLLLNIFNDSYLTLNLLNFLDGIIHLLFLELYIVIFRGTVTR